MSESAPLISNGSGGGGGEGQQGWRQASAAARRGSRDGTSGIIDGGGVSAAAARARTVRRALVIALALVGLALLAAVLASSRNHRSAIGSDGDGSDAADRAEKQQQSSSSSSSGSARSEELMRSARAYMDLSMDPCADFYTYACGGFERDNPVPVDESRWDSHSIMMRHSAEKLVRVVERLVERYDKAAAGAASGDSGAGHKHHKRDLKPHQERIAKFYKSCLAENNGSGGDDDDKLASVRLLLSALDHATTKQQLFAVLGEVHRRVIDPHGNLPKPLFSYEVLPDAGDPKHMVFTVQQGGLGLPSRDYYVRDVYSSILAEYPQHVARVLQLSGVGEDESRRAAAFIVDLERRLAEASVPEQQIGDDARGKYNPMTLRELSEKLAPGVSWHEYFAALFQLKPDEHGRVQVYEPLVAEWPPFLRNVSAYVESITEPLLFAHYLRWHVLRSVAPTLPDGALAEETFRFFGRLVNGKQQQRPRELRCIAALDENLGDDLGREYVHHFFDESSRKVAQRLIGEIEEVFAKTLKRDSSSWLGGNSTAAAVHKVRQIRNNVGYTSKWDDYRGVKVRSDDFVGNVLQCREHNTLNALAQVGHPRNLSLWDMTPPTVNAYYEALTNEMNFPAGNFAPNFYSLHYPDAVNYGGVGNVVGHELGHGFDSNGRQYDGRGKLGEWMSASAVREYERRAQCVVDLYSGFEVQDGIYLNGRLTLQENLADVAGVKSAHRAYLERYKRMSSAERRREKRLAALVFNGLTPEQLHFVAFAQTWCRTDTPEYLKQSVSVDVHSPGKFRVLGALSQYPPFGEAYGCDVGTPMRPKQVCELW